MEIESSDNPQLFSDFEHNAWEVVSHDYEKHFSRLTSQSAEAILDAAEVTRGTRVLDVCCGPGMITAAASARGSEAIGIDFSDEAIKIATSNVTGAQFKVGDAQNLPFDDNSFDSVICGFGIIHVPNPILALSEMHRVLKLEGRLAVSTWDAPGSNNGFGLLFGAIKANANMDIDLPHGPDFFQFSSHGKLLNALTETGFEDARAKTIEQHWEFSDSQGFIAAYMEGSVRSRALLMAQTKVVQNAINKNITAGIEKYRYIGKYRIPMPALIGSALKV